MRQSPGVGTKYPVLTRYTVGGLCIFVGEFEKYRICCGCWIRGIQNGGWGGGWRGWSGGGRKLFEKLGLSPFGRDLPGDLLVARRLN